MEMFLAEAFGNIHTTFNSTKNQVMISHLEQDNIEKPADNEYYKEHTESLGLTPQEYLRLKNFEHWQVENIETVFLGKPFKISSPYWFLQSVEEIFIHEVYKFDTEKAQPLILDCGANWGLSVIYFKLRFPNASVRAYEADKEIYAMARENISAFGFDKVSLYNKAVWDANCNLVFSSEGSVGGSIADLGINSTTANYDDAPEGSWIGNYNTYYGIHKTEEKQVKAVRLRDILKWYTAIDFLKIDIEGAEYKVIIDCAEELGKVDKMFVEYHSIPGQPQTLHKILEVIALSGFRYYIKEAANNFSFPFIRDRQLLYDLQLNIFCFR
jgi:FkbM family methyltransferase